MLQLANMTLPCLLELDYEELSTLWVSERSRFSDPQWDFATASSPKARHHYIFEFTKLFDSDNTLDEQSMQNWIRTTKIFALSLLKEPPRPNLRLETFAQVFRKGGFINLLRYCGRNAIFCLAELTMQDFDDFLNGICQTNERTLELTDATLRSRLRGLEWFFSQLTKIGETLDFDPWAKYGGQSKFVQVAAKRVRPRGSLTTSPIPADIVERMVAAAKRELSDAGRLAILFREKSKWSSGSSEEKKSKRKGETFPYANYGYIDSHHAEAQYIRIRTATAIIVGLFTGMRGTEILSVSSSLDKAITYEQVKIGESIVNCIFLSSVDSKHLAEPEIREWQTVPLVAEFLRALDNINLTLQVPESPWIFRAGRAVRRGGHHFDTTQINVGQLSSDIRNFLRFHEVLALPIKFSISSRSLRRTFARLVARNGMGIVELQTQLKHIDPDVTRMYGAVDLLSDESIERRIWSEECFEGLLLSDGLLVGGGAPEAVEMRNEFRGMSRPDRKKFVRSLPATTVVDQMEYGLCLYRSERALCGGNKIACKPDRCQNSVISFDAARDALEYRYCENKTLLKLVGDSPLKRSHLLAQLKQIEELLTQGGEDLS